MRKETINLRKTWIQEKWNEHGNSLSMKDLGEVFGVSTTYIFKVLKGRQEKQNNESMTEEK